MASLFLQSQENRTPPPFSMNRFMKAGIVALPNRRVAVKELWRAGRLAAFRFPKALLRSQSPFRQNDPEGSASHFVLMLATVATFRNRIARCG
ncbi:MAG TPA: hypothetical protein VM468_13720 [Mycoplana sp.]|nr:hypothetical protein [Mycoplana sp.]